MDDVRQISRQLPVSIFDGHILAAANIYRKPDTVLIQITVDGSNGQLLADFLEKIEPIALAFSSANPIRNINEKRENI